MEHLSHRLHAELRAGESILWIGKPHERALSWKDGASLLGWLFAIAVAIRAARSQDGFDFDSFHGVASSVLALIGFLIYVARRMNLEYAVTSERVLIASRFPWPKVFSVELATLDHVSLRPAPDGRGTLTFVESRLGLVEGISHQATDETRELRRLERIEAADQVKELIERAKRALEGGHGARSDA